MPVVFEATALNGVSAMSGQLNILERELIAKFHRKGISKGEIARRLGRHRCTIGRELARNGERGDYSAAAAHEKAQARRSRRPRKLDDGPLNGFVREGLVNYWSPEQIAGRSRIEFRRQPRRQVSFNTIYRWIAGDPHEKHWRSFLRFGTRRTGPETRGKLVARAEIAGRPAIVQTRGRFGDWEGDTIVGKRRHSGLVTLVERKSGFGMIGKVHGLKARNVLRAARQQFADLPPGLRHTATFDNGKEFAGHERLARATNVDIFFARPYHAWERGANENYNGLLRQFFPKGTDFRSVSPIEVKHVHELLNDRPRKRLGFRTPREVLGQYFPVAFQL
jgi:IS30 family transposase